MKTNYLAHDDRYRFQKKKGMPGWDSEEQLKKNITALEEIFSRDEIPKEGKLLELGCGAGNASIWLAEKGYEIHGIDISPTAIQWAKEKADNENITASFTEGSVLDLDYQDNTFDIVMDGHCFHCIIGDDRNTFLEEAGRVLKPGGILMIMTMCGNVTDENIKNKFDEETKCLILDGIAARYIGSLEDVLNEIKNSGFRLIDWKIIERESQNDQDELIVLATL